MHKLDITGGGYKSWITDYFRLHPFDELVLKQLMEKISNSKHATLSYGTFHRAIEQMHHYGILNLRRLGNYKLCSLNLANRLSLAQLAASNAFALTKFYQKHKILEEPLENLQRGIIGMTKAYPIMALFGSYAKGTERPGSDADLLFISDEKADASIIEGECTRYSARYGIEIRPLIISTKDFLAALKAKDHNVIKEVLASNIILLNLERYYLLLQEVRHGS